MKILNPIVEILMNRDGLKYEEASEMYEEMQQRMLDGDDPEEILYEIGLEPDYVFDLFPF